MNVKMKLFYFTGLITIFLVVFFVNIPKTQAHPGNTAADGCHYCWTNCASWGEVYGQRHCHNTYTTPTYRPYIPPIQTWSCTISGIKYTSTNSAQAKWRELVHNAVDDTYKKLLERNANQNDYNYWESKIPYNNCNFNVVPQTIWNEVNGSDERKALSAKKVEERKKQTSIVASSNNQNPTNSSSTNSDYDWMWWAVPIGIVALMVWIINTGISRGAKNNKNKLFCVECGESLFDGQHYCTKCGKDIIKEKE